MEKLDKRRKNANWTIGDGMSRAVPPLDAALAVLMDIRDELQEQNVLLKKIAARTNRIPPRIRLNRS